MKKYDVFISYSRKDSAFAEKVCAVLDEYKQHYKFEYFFDCEDIKSKHDYLVRISEAISESRVMLFLASKNSTASEFCLKELLFADEEHVQIHQYRLDDTAYPKSIRLLLGNHHYRVAKEFSIENMVREVLTDTLKYEIKPLEDLRVVEEAEESEDNKKPNRILKKIILAVATLAMLCGLYLGVEAILNIGKYKVGDYYNDGIKEGVVFWVDESGKHGKIVSLDQERLQWCTEEQYEKGITVGTESWEDGKENTNMLISRPDKEEYPAFLWCVNKGTDWYLPAIEELSLLLIDDESHNAVNRTLEHIGAVKMLDKGEWRWYWTSTEYKNKSDKNAWYVGMSSGFTSNYSKNDTSFVRAVAQF